MRARGSVGVWRGRNVISGSGEGEKDWRGGVAESGERRGEIGVGEEDAHEEGEGEREGESNEGRLRGIWVCREGGDFEGEGVREMVIGGGRWG